MTKIFEKITAEKKFNNFLIKNCILPIFSPNYRSLQPSKKNIQHLKTWNLVLLNFFYLCGSFLSPVYGSGFRIWIRIHWPDLIESGSETLRLSTAGHVVRRTTMKGQRWKSLICTCKYYCFMFQQSWSNASRKKLSKKCTRDTTAGWLSLQNKTNCKLATFA